jgi:hypothetical protein
MFLMGVSKFWRHAVKWGSIAVSANVDFFAVLLAYALSAFLVSREWKIPISLHIYDQSFALFSIATTVLLISFLTVRLIWRRRPERPILLLWNSSTDWGLQNRLYRLSITFPVALALPVFFSIFTSMKGSISSIVPFYADPLLAHIDFVLMGNNDAWRILHPIIGLPGITFVLNFFYNLWLPVMLITLFCMVFFVSDLNLRRQYLVTWALIWVILGNVFAIIFSSVGPCFYKTFYGSPHYDALMAYLHSASAEYPIWSLTAQKYLLAQKDGVQLGAGISAFPSMHVAVAMLNVMLCRNFSRFWQILSVLFLGLILVGSIELGWHYAIDGGFSIIAVPIIWWVASKLSLAQLIGTRTVLSVKGTF